MSGRVGQSFRRSCVFLCVALLCLAAIGTPRAESGSFTFTKIVDTNTPIPGGVGNFVAFGAPVFDGTTVAFWAPGLCFCSSQIGVYASTGGSLQKLADSNTPIPGSVGNFDNFNEAEIRGGTVAFFGANGFVSSGIYASSGGSLTRVADLNTAVPDGIGNFQYFVPEVAVDDGRVLFTGLGSFSTAGLYSFAAGSLTTVVDFNMVMPGSGIPFGGFFGPAARAGNLAFGAFGSFNPFSTQGLFTLIDGSLATVVDMNTPIPGGSGNFAFFGNPSFDGSNVAFIGFDSTFTLHGIYVADSTGALGVIANTTTPAPGGTGHFVQFFDPAIDNGVVVFVGIDEIGMSAIYRAVGGVLTRVIGSGDMLDGRLLGRVRMQRHERVSGTFAFMASDAEGWQGIFLASEETLPTNVFLHRSGSSLVLDSIGPTAATPASLDSAGLKFSGGNPWKEIGTWSAPASMTAGTLDFISPLHAWVGLKNSDDIGTRFDLRAEILENGNLVGSGEATCISGVKRDPAQALEVSVPFGSLSPTSFNGTTDALSVRILARIGTTGSGGFCGGHSNATGLRLYFDAVSRPSRFDVRFAD
jgi:hypothetical protein